MFIKINIFLSYIKNGKFLEKFMAIFPFLLFFPIGVLYAGLLIFVFLWFVDGDYHKKWFNIRQDLLFYPVIALISVVYLNVFFLSSENTLRWPSLVHYQIFLLYFLFVSIGLGDWQQRAKNVFIMGAIYGSSVFYLAYFKLLPDWSIFKKYVLYSGNQSISFGIFLAIAAAWLLNDVLDSTTKRRQWIGSVGFTYIALAVLFLATTRTGMLLFFILSLLVIVRHLKFSLRGLALAISLLVVPVAIWQSSSVLQERSLVTIEAVRAFLGGEMGTEQGSRLQFVSKTGAMIMEKPLLGHGVGSWLQQYPVRAQGLETAQMSTPHSDYLLYTAELGIVGLLALLGVLGHLLIIAWRTGGVRGMQLLVLGCALVVGCTFNAILRDWKFGLPMMLLLAVAMTSDRHIKYVQPTPVV